MLTKNQEAGRYPRKRYEIANYKLQITKIEPRIKNISTKQAYKCELGTKKQEDIHEKGKKLRNTNHESRRKNKKCDFALGPPHNSPF